METKNGKVNVHEKLIDQEMLKKKEVGIKQRRVLREIIPDVYRAQGIQPRRRDWRTSSRTGHTGHGASGA